MRALALLLLLPLTAQADDSTVKAAAAMPYGVGGPMDLPLESCTTGVEVPDQYLELLGKLNEPVSNRQEYPRSEPPRSRTLTVVHGGAENERGTSSENGVKVIRGNGN